MVQESMFRLSTMHVFIEKWTYKVKPWNLDQDDTKMDGLSNYNF